MPEVDLIPLTVPHSLAENEAIIERGLATFVEVGTALREIREEDQYKQAGFADFDSYVKDRWGMARSYAYQTIAAAEVSTMVDTVGLPAPANERAARPLVAYMNTHGVYDYREHRLRYPERGREAVLEAWRSIVEQHQDPERPITGAEVQQYLYPPANTGTSKSWLEAIGTVGDKLKAAEKAMDRAERMVGNRSSEKVRVKAEQYANWADNLAARLREIAAD